MHPIAEPRAVNWYYAHNGQQAGPVPDAELENLVRRGVVTPGTLVWHEGLPQWQPYSALRQPAASPSGAPPVIAQGQCAECRGFFSKDDLLKYEDALVCAGCKAAFFQKLREGVAPGLASLSGLWRSGKYLVMHKDCQLPDRCVKCNKPAAGYRLKRNLTWHTPWLYLLLVAAWLIYLIVAAIVSKKARIQIGLCDEHRGIRQRDIIITWIFVLSGIFSLGAGIVMKPGWVYALSGLGLLLVAIIYGVCRVPMVQPKRIDEQHVWLHGVSEEFMAELPEFTGRP